MPLLDGHLIHQDVLGGLAMQSHPCELLCISRPKEKNMVLGQLNTRNLLRQYAQEPYVMYMDSDVVLTSENDVSDLVGGMKSRCCDILALNSKGVDVEAVKKINHIPISCTMWKFGALQKYAWMFSNPRRCICQDVNDALNIEFLDNRKLKEVAR